MTNTRKFLKTVFFTILLYRSITYIIIYFYGNTAWWNGVYTDKWNHYQLGALLLIIDLIFYKLKKLQKYQLVIAGVGTGMIIDEVTDVIKFFHLYPLPSHFRDSFADLMLIIFTYITFSLICLGIEKYNKSKPSVKPHQ